MAAASGASVHGVVIDAMTGQGQIGITVTIGSVGVNTDSSGNWTAANIPPGTPAITFSGPGYETQTTQGFTIQSGVDNNFGTQPVFAITDSVISLSVFGVTADFWQLGMKDANGKTSGMYAIPLSYVQKIYLDSSWVFPIAFNVAAYKYIGTNEVNQVSNWGDIYSKYSLLSFSGVGIYTLNLGSGALTLNGTPVTLPPTNILAKYVIGQAYGMAYANWMPVQYYNMVNAEYSAGKDIDATTWIIMENYYSAHDTTKTLLQVIQSEFPGVDLSK